MKKTFAAAGAVLGAVVGIVSHFMSYKLPSVYYFGYTSDGSALPLSGAPGLVHPSWWPSLPIAVVAGAVVGFGLAYLAGRLGLSFSWRADRSAEPNR